MAPSHALLLVLAGLSASGLACGRSASEQPDIPEAAVFDQTLRRDLESYFTQADSSPIQVTFELVSDQPIISGIAYPKYCVWVEARSGERLVRVGAVRVTAINKSFKVSDFLSAETINNDPQSVAKVFPRELVGDLTKRAHDASQPPRRGV